MLSWYTFRPQSYSEDYSRLRVLFSILVSYTGLLQLISNCVKHSWWGVASSAHRTIHWCIEPAFVACSLWLLSPFRLLPVPTTNMGCLQHLHWIIVVYHTHSHSSNFQIREESLVLSSCKKAVHSQKCISVVEDQDQCKWKRKWICW